VVERAVIEDKRKSGRQKLFLRGFIRTPLYNSNIDCIVRDLSETGAKLRFRCTLSITDFLELHIPTKGQILQSKVAWIDGCEVGVSFDPVVAFGTPSSSDGELPVRMARLEDEITALKQMLTRLQKQVDKTEVA
jgi:PilZ domain